MLENFRTDSISWDKASQREQEFSYTSLRANQSDNNGRKLSVTITDKGKVADLTGASLSLYWENYSRTAKGLDAFKIVNAKIGIFEITYTNEMLSNIGKITANLVLIENSGRIVSEAFTIRVERGIDDEAIVGSVSFTALTEALSKVNDLEDNYAPRLNDLIAQLAQKATKGEIGLNDLNKNTTQFDETWMTDEFKQQMTGTTPVNATPADGGVTSAKLADKAVNDRHLSTDIVTNTSANLFTEDNAEHGYRLGTGGQMVADPIWMLSEFIPVNSGDVVTLITSDQTSTSVQCGRVALYNADYTFNSLVSELTSATLDKTTTTINIDGFIRVPSRKNGVQISLTRNLDIGSVEPFQRMFRNKFVFNPQDKSIQSDHIGYEEITELNTNFIEPVKNLYNENDPDIITGYLLNGNGGEPLVSLAYNISGFIWIKKGVTYSFTSMRSYKLFNKHKNYINGSFIQFSGHTGNTVTPEEDCYIRFSHLNSNPVQMEVGAVSTSYTPYQYKLRDDIQTSVNSSQLIVNPLYNKRILFNGDSVTASSVYPTSGWARLIGLGNSMDWVNYGQDGKTIARRGDDVANSIVRDIDTMSADADYVVLHGGLNDFGNSIPLGSVTSGYNDTYDEFTFAGAFESMLRKSILKWKGKKIGFIITYKSSTNPAQYNPYYNIAREACEKWSVPYLDLYKASGLTLQLDEIANEYTTNGDRKHPNEKGYEVITPKIEAWLRTL